MKTSCHRRGRHVAGVDRRLRDRAGDEFRVIAAEGADRAV
jgi:hypothetical protein